MFSPLKLSEALSCFQLLDRPAVSIRVANVLVGPAHAAPEKTLERLKKEESIVRLQEALSDGGSAPQIGHNQRVLHLCNRITWILCVFYESQRCGFQS